MRNYLLLLVAIVVMASCSAPKHAYYFDHYDYHAGKRKQQTDVLNSHEVAVDDFEQAKLVHEETLLASVSTEVVVIAEEPRPIPGDTETTAKVEKQYSDMSKSERKEVRKEFRKDLKEYKNAKKSGDEVRAEQAKEKLTGYTRVGVILIIAGLVLAILSLGSVINSIGGLMVLAGIIFILVDIL